jgi:nucleoside diphosphate kinase
VDSIYESSQNESFYQAMKDYLTNHDVIVLLVGGEGLKAQQVLLSLKKDNNQDGIIRQQLQKDPQISTADLELWQSGRHPQQDDLSVVLTQKNVIHTADTTEEALKSLKEILGDKFELLQKRGNLPAELWDIFK